MADFYAEIQGSRGVASRIGSHNSGINGHIRGWNLGVEVIGTYDNTTKQKMFKVYKTGGSNISDKHLILTITKKQILLPDGSKLI